MKWQFKDSSIIAPTTSGSLGGMKCKYADSNDGHRIQVDDKAQAVLFDRTPLVTGEDALHSVKIIHAIYESSKTGKEVFI